MAETSLTVPGIKYVIDPGTARISRYSYRTKVQRLPIEPVSQASANQRKGRCGRVSEGICIRLYSEDDFLSRPEFTDPEILRTNLASVILQMIITSALSIQDPRERPMDKQQASDEKHRRFHDKESDFLAFVNLWNYLGEQQKALSSNQFRRQCRVDFLNYLRVREWQDIYTQLRQVVKELGIPVNSEPAEYREIHIALLTGLLSHIGMKDAEKFTACRWSPRARSTTARSIRRSAASCLSVTRWWRETGRRATPSSAKT